MAASNESGRTGTKVGAVFGKTIDFAVAAVRLIGVVFALVLAVHIVLTLFDANPDNQITTFFADFSAQLVLWFQDLFTPADPKIAVVVNYGLAAVFWLLVTALVAKLLRAVR